MAIDAHRWMPVVTQGYPWVSLSTVWRVVFWCRSLWPRPKPRRARVERRRGADGVWRWEITHDPR